VGLEDQQDRVDRVGPVNLCHLVSLAVREILKIQIIPMGQLVRESQVIQLAHLDLELPMVHLVLVVHSDRLVLNLQIFLLVLEHPGDLVVLPDLMSLVDRQSLEDH